MRHLNPDAACKLALAVLETESAAIQRLADHIDEKFITACEHLLNCQGRVVVLGMGKSGHIASKIAATFASTGCPAFFVHPGEASHGDMGMITPNDVVLAISYSGNTQEICTLLPLIKRLGIPLIALTGHPDSNLGTAATVVLNVGIDQEACPLGLAPTASTTAALAMGDALAVALLDARGFTADDFALSHPGGSLGRRLLLRVSDIMHQGDDIPTVLENTTLSDALIEITAKKLGLTTIVNERGDLLGIFTDGDLRRIIKNEINIHTTPITEVMSTMCKTMHEDSLASEALNLMETYKITAIVVTDAHEQISGIIHMHDLLRAGVI